MEEPTTTNTTPNASSTQVFTITQEQHEAAITAARRDEKNKLYPDIEKHKEANRRLEADLAEARSQLSKSTNDAKRTEELQAKIAEMESSFSRVLDETLEKARTETSKRFEESELKAYRAELIASAGGKVLPELVHGTTREEILASFNASKVRFAEIADAAAKEKEEELRKTYRGQLPTSEVPGSTTHDDAPDASSYRKLTGKEWEQQKEKLKQEAFAKAGLPMKAGRA